MWYGDWGARGAQYWARETALVEVVPGTAPGTGARTRRFTYAELDARANRLAAWLRDRAGVRRGDRIGMIALNGVEVVDALLACGKLGAVLVPFNWRLHASELGELVRRVGPRVVLFSDELAALTREATSGQPLVHLDGPGLPGSASYEEALASSPADPVADPAWKETDVACLLFTGGTTGLPRAARITYRQIAWNTFTTLVHEIRPGDVTITHTPMFHTGGLFVYTIPFLTIGGRVVVMRRWDAALALKLLQEEHVTAFFAVPTQYQQLLEAPGFTEADLSRIRYLTSGGAAMPGPLREAWRKAHPAIPFKQGFGMTEFGPGVFSMRAEDADRKAGSIGQVNQFIEARLVDEQGRDVPTGEVGELLLRGPACCDGYEGPEGTTREGIDAEGWLHTGDLMRRDGEGHHWVAGRRKDMFISGGENVYPLEVETALLAHPAVAMAAVVGVPDPRWGEVGHAFFTARPGTSAEPEALLEHLRARLARYKVPKAVTRLEAMPLTAAGKIQKTELRARALAEGGAR